ncbi:hypothetical protein [Thiorhodovibrio frisius]|uniref:Uncharacterized protein n=1 Tax=Thiorhodovibrio frisius TaxID=631362 RepID=H8Z098_9GAMM|nr:hypothetical protein [Thiorhodovibrio frisius]EIC22306.1 hypothetical protein Thi970DRAFT_02559 [Thiorhodovibrio frisius]WPL24603.1 hypothetical protein Thiofri_04823 [Thiorhodovibrio frisius]
MIESLFSAILPWILQKGTDQRQNSIEFQNAQLAIREAVNRELRSNRALIDEFLERADGDGQVACKLADELSFTAMERIEQSMIPLAILFACPQPPQSREPQPQFQNWSAQLNTEAFWIERIYLRLRILRARWRAGQKYQENSMRYIQWLIAAWLANANDKERSSS